MKAWERISSSRGRSPRVRGRRPGCHRAARPAGSIPAGAGETRTIPRGSSPGRVDPRGCGGDRRAVRLSSSHQGRSPRVRGRLPALKASMTTPGSIPAGAGETNRHGGVIDVFEVDPRGCGGDRHAVYGFERLRGRSPRVRGRPTRLCGSSVALRSIPAGAGETGVTGGRCVRRRVDPRGCGGDAGVLGTTRPVDGRSPRVRGRRYPPEDRRGGPGSIPAGAGETPGRTDAPSSGGVDPRGCGGDQLDDGTVIA